MRYQMQWVHSKTGETILVAEIDTNDFIEPDGRLSGQMHNHAYDCLATSIEEGEWPGPRWHPSWVPETSDQFWQRDSEGRYIRPISPIEVEI